MDNRNKLEAEKKELVEAIRAGEATDRSISKMLGKLSSAKGWGVWDIMGGKLFSNIAKHSAINKANEISHEVEDNLRAFQRELNDVNQFVDLKVNLSGFATFADFFFDGLFADFFVQSKIKEAIRNAENLQKEVNNILGGLERNLKDINRKLSETDKVFRP